MVRKNIEMGFTLIDLAALGLVVPKVGSGITWGGAL